MSNQSFKDYFSEISQNYQASRPEYPEALFNYLASLSDHHGLAWDCATGNGQAAKGLSGLFKTVIATDASAEQIATAPNNEKHEKSNILFRVATAENSGIDNSSTDLITVAQALHWFDIDRFTAECDRVLSANGILAVWCYKLLSISPEIDEIIQRFYFGEIGQYWPEERQMVDNGYTDIAFPFTELETPEFVMQARWSLQHLLNYLNTWSAVSKYKQKNNCNPVDLITQELQQAWGTEHRERIVEWPLMLRVFKNA